MATFSEVVMAFSVEGTVFSEEMMFSVGTVFSVEATIFSGVMMLSEVAKVSEFEVVDREFELSETVAIFEVAISFEGVKVSNVMGEKDELEEENELPPKSN